MCGEWRSTHRLLIGLPSGRASDRGSSSSNAANAPSTTIGGSCPTSKPRSVSGCEPNTSWFSDGRGPRHVVDSVLIPARTSYAACTKRCSPVMTRPYPPGWRNCSCRPYSADSPPGTNGRPGRSGFAHRPLHRPVPARPLPLRARPRTAPRLLFYRDVCGDVKNEQQGGVRLRQHESPSDRGFELGAPDRKPEMWKRRCSTPWTPSTCHRRCWPGPAVSSPPQQQDRQLIELLGAGIRTTSPYAEVLGIAHLPSVPRAGQ